MVSCILLCAGENRRFGAPKALARLNSKTVIEHLQDTFLKSNISEIIIVLGSSAKDIQPFILKDKKIKTVLNKNYKLGQTSSFKEGLKNVSCNAKGIMLLPVDLPLIKKETLDSLIELFLEKNPLLLIPTYQNKHGHPPIFNVNLKEKLLNLKGNEPLYSIQHKYKDSLLEFETDDIGVIKSFNTQEEFSALKILSGVIGSSLIRTPNAS